MEITKPGQLTGPIIREMRQKAGKTQSEFWGPLGVNRSRASSYERENHKIDEPVQQLVYLHHICRFPVGLAHESMVMAGSVASGAAEGSDAIKRAIAIAEGGADVLRSAIACMEP